MEEYFWLTWSCVLVFAIFMVGIAKPGERLKAAAFMALAVLLTYLMTEVNLPIVKYLVLAMALFALLLVGFIFWLVRRLNKIAQQLWAAQQAYQANHDAAAYLIALEKCSRNLNIIKWISNRATIKFDVNPADKAAEIKLWDYLAQEKQRIQKELEKNI